MGMPITGGVSSFGTLSMSLIVGLEDFETRERIFSALNHIASTTHHATTFHRHQAIEEHFSFWDQDKYVNLSMFLHTYASL